MTKVKREDIHLVSRFSNWTKEAVDEKLKQNVYSDKASWYQFLRLLLISLSTSFIAAGVVFFFAYNWADLHKFVKIGMVQVAILATVISALSLKTTPTVRNILLAGASVLVGVQFAVFGQIYQTGANAYDFFMGWTVFITLWAIATNFAPLWLFWITLLNATLIFYSMQVARDWSDIVVYLLLFVVDTAFLVFLLFGKRLSLQLAQPMWLSNLVALATVSCSTLGIIDGIWGRTDAAFSILILVTMIMYGLGLLYGYRVKRPFYLSIISFSVIVIISSWILRSSFNISVFFTVTIFIILSITLVITSLLKLQKRWKSE